MEFALIQEEHARKREASLLELKLEKLDPKLRHYLFYESCSQGLRKRSVEDICARYAVIERVRLILAECPKAHPEAALSFCLSRSGGPKEFTDLKNKILAVFRLEGCRIFSIWERLCKTELEKMSPFLGEHLCVPMVFDGFSLLKDTPLEQDYQDFIKTRDCAHSQV